jgi:hypothetical protein
MSDIFPDNGIRPIPPQYVPLSNTLAQLFKLYGAVPDNCPPSVTIDAMNALIEEIAALYDQSGICAPKNGGPTLLSTSNWLNLVNSTIYLVYGNGVPCLSQLMSKGITPANGFPTAYLNDTVSTPVFYVWNATLAKYVTISGGGGSPVHIYTDATLKGIGTVGDPLGWTGAYTDGTMRGDGLVGNPLHAIPLPDLFPYMNTNNYNYPVNTWLKPSVLNGGHVGSLNAQAYVIAYFNPVLGFTGLYFTDVLSIAQAQGGQVLAGVWMFTGPLLGFYDGRPLVVRVA